MAHWPVWCYGSGVPKASKLNTEGHCIVIGKELTQDDE